MASSGAHFAKETKMIQIRGTEIFKSMSGIHFKGRQRRNKSNINLFVFQPYAKKAWSKLFGINSIAILATNHLDDVQKSKDFLSMGQMA